MDYTREKRMRSSATPMTVYSMIELLMEHYNITYEYAVYLMSLPIMEAVEIINKLKEEQCTSFNKN